MNRHMKNLSFLFLIGLISMISCNTDYQETNVQLDQYQIERGLSISSVAAEPLIEAPVDISFDDQGRAWVLEMRGYMRSLAGTGEEDPVGRIVVLQDLDGDGQSDHIKVFLDSLQLARSIAHVYGGLLYAEPPNLWFVEIDHNLQPGERELVDSEYAVGGNVEHQPNGLLLNIDNWIYNAKSTKRYRRVKGEWIIEGTSFRGQWGITRDPFGRLLYNDNSNQLRGDYVLPNTLNGNSHFQSQIAIGKRVVDDQRVYPLQATPINRGYMDGVLDEEGKLVNVTSACGPLYFQGSALPGEYDGNAFVCVPEANLIKRNILYKDGFRLKGVQAYQDKEFLITSDQGFRPVNLKNGPDGGMYIADMHRGIIQHKTYMTSYLRDKLIETGLDSLVGMGRILRVASTGNNIRYVDLSALQLRDWLDSLNSDNIWIRDRAQHLLIESGNKTIVPALKEILFQSENEISRVHALYVIEGLDQLSEFAIQMADFESFPRLSAHLLKLAGDGSMEINADYSTPINDSTIAYYSVYYYSNKANTGEVERILEAYGDKDWITEPVLSEYKEEAEQFQSVKLIEAIDALREKENRPQIREVAVEFRGLTPGLNLYRTNCAVCHGQDGQGLTDLAPPLLESEYVKGDPEQLANILLYGLSGPITVAGTDYTFGVAMPGLKSNPEISDEDIRYIMNYIRNAFTTSSIVRPGELIKNVREKDRDATDVYTQEELNEKFNN